ncbi:MAG: acyl-CoA thioesterase [Alphaproteobacteria bacterium]|nr:MAG: acyl-CoA thioesterase [Alphaproteobacteria bacterium]
MIANSVTREVEWGECDPAGIVFNPNFSRWFDHCTSLLYAAAGWPKPAILREFGILGCPLVESHLSFRAPARYGEIVTIDSSIAEIGRSSFKVRHHARVGERSCCTALDTRVWTIRDPESGRLRAAELPAAIVAAFRAEGAAGGADAG